MLPSFLVNTYKRYKQDTAEFSFWLDTTARECGYSGPAPAPKPGGLLGGGTRYLIPLSKFTTLAKTVADFDPRVVIPQHIGKIGRRVVALRQRCSRWYQNENFLMSKADKGHEHMIRVFQESLRILNLADEEEQPPPSAEPAKPAQKTNNREKVDAMINRFMALELEEPEDLPTTEKATSGSGGTTSSQKPSAAQYEIDDDLEKGSDDSSSDDSDDWEDSSSNESDEDFELPPIVFEIFCLLEDLKALREFVKQLWTDFRSGKVDLMTAAAVTNTAIDFARRGCDEFVTENPEVTNAKRFQELFLAFASVIRGEDGTYREKKDDPYNMNLHDLVKWGYHDTFLLLDAMTRVYHPGEVPVYKPGYYGTYDPRESRSKMGPRKKFAEDKILLSEAFPEFAMLAGFRIPLPAYDEFSRGMIEMLKTGDFPLWLCFAARIFCDIQHRLRTEAVVPFNILKTESNRIKKTLDAHFKFSTNLKTPNWPAQNEANLKRISKDIEMYVINDFFVVVKNAKAKMFGKHSHTFLKRHCLQAGIMLFNLNLRMNDAGILLASAWGSIIYPAFLYNDIKQQNYAKLEWSDMEQVIAFHGEENVFGGKKPKNTKESFLQSSTMLGINTDAPRGTGRRAPESMASSAGPKGLTMTTEISKLFKKRYVYGESVQVSFKAVEELLNELNNKDLAERSAASSALKKKWDTKKNLAPLELLALLREKLMDEERKLLFNYFGLHQRCIELLRLLRREHHEKFVQYFTDKYMEQEYQLSFVVNYIFMVGAGSHSNLQALAPDTSQNVEVRSLMLTKTGDIMAKWLAPNGAVGAKELQSKAKNKHLLDPQKAAVNKSSGLLDSGYLIALSDVLGLSPQEAKAMSTGPQGLLSQT